MFAPNDRAKSRPFRILDGASERGPRLGGRAPRIDFDARLRVEAIYVMTIPLSSAPDLELSIFVQGELWSAMNDGLQKDDRIVALVHPPSERRDDGRFRSPLSEHRIVIGDETDDLEQNAEWNALRPKPDHKLGGRPYCIQEAELEGAEALLDRGIFQLVQLDFPSGEDGEVSGSWPFADGMFNLFSAPPYDEIYWAFQK